MKHEGWEARMAARARERRKAASRELENRRAAGEHVPHTDADWTAIPTVLRAELPEGQPDIARHWCTSCGLADAPMPDRYGPIVPCPQCGSPWRWYGRIADRDGTATEPPPPPNDCSLCWEWRRYNDGQEHFGWGWWMVCGQIGDCQHAHHADDVWLAG